MLMLWTKTYPIIQIPKIVAGIRTLWQGRYNFTGSFMKESTSYKALFEHDYGRDTDFEAIERQKVFSFQR